MAEHERRTTARQRGARQSAGRDISREDGSAAARQAVVNPSKVTRQQALSLQRSIGNAAVQRLLAPVVQRRLWDNVAAKFQTENDEGAANSEYVVTTSGYRRYAPVNILRGVYDQIYYNSNNRSFLYLIGMSDDLDSEEYEAVFNLPQVQSIVGSTVTLTSAGAPEAPPVVASMVPTDGATVYDATVNDDGSVNPDMHVGHEVANLGQPLPTLDDPTALTEALKNVFVSGRVNQGTAAADKRKKEIKSNPYI